MMLANKLFSAIYVSGTALAIATVTVFSLMYYVKVAPVYPESHRLKTYYLKYVENGEKGSERKNINNPSYPLYRDYLSKLKNVLIVSACSNGWENYVQIPGEEREVEVAVKGTDTAFFRLYEYDFIEGRPFTDEEYDAGVFTAVISDHLATELFGKDKDIVGNMVSVDYQEYRICGVIREGSQLLPDSYAQIIYPLSTVDDYDVEYRPFVGGLYVTFVSDDGDALKKEVDEIARRFNNSNDNYEVSFLDMPHSHVFEVFNPHPLRGTVSVMAIVKKNLIVLLVLLLVPALNLSGLISSRMDMRSSEIGIRRSFGGTKCQLLKQVLWENLLLTMIGGAVGLLIVWGSLLSSSGTLLTLLDESYQEVSSFNLTPEILYAPAIFIVAFVMCVVLNLLSALVPAWLSLRKSVVDNIR